MPTLQVEQLVFAFQPTVAAEPYEKWQHYITVWNANGGQKALDVIAVENPATPITTWLIEAKDFRVITQRPRPSNIAGLAQTVADKTAHTLAGLTDASANAVDASEKDYATRSLSAPVRRVVLHLEPHTGPHTALFPLGFAAGVLQQLRQLVRGIDPNPLVLNIASTAKAGVPWTVA
jgi:hypothetical protein